MPLQLILDPFISPFRSFWKLVGGLKYTKLGKIISLGNIWKDYLNGSFTKQTCWKKAVYNLIALVFESFIFCWECFCSFLEIEIKCFLFIFFGHCSHKLIGPQECSCCLIMLLSHVWLNGDSRECSPPGSSVHGMSLARILKWVAIYFSRGSSWPGDQTCVSCIAAGFFSTEPPGKPDKNIKWNSGGPQDFPRGTVDRNLPASSGHTSLITSPGRSHTLWSSSAHAPPPSPRSGAHVRAVTLEPVRPRGARGCAPQDEEPAWEALPTAATRAGARRWRTRAASSKWINESLNGNMKRSAVQCCLFTSTSRAWQLTPVFLPGESPWTKAWQLQSMGSQSQTRLSDST